MDQHGRYFEVGQTVDSIFDKGTIYRIVELHPPTHRGDYSTYLRLELIKLGAEFGVGQEAGRMADGRSYAPYHFNTVTLPLE